MHVDLRSPEQVTTERDKTEPAGKTRGGSLETYFNALATLTTPEAAIALAYGVPNLDNTELVRFLNERRVAAKRPATPPRVPDGRPPG
jgi:hypothetical protein